MSINGAAQITSPFNSSVEGWTAPNSVGNAISFIGSGGNPNGFARAFPDFVPAVILPPFPVYFNFIAPAAFLGNFSTYYNGNITFDLRQTTFTTAVAQPEVIITDGITVLYYYPPTPFNPPTASWATYSVTLNSLSGYWKTANSSTGPAASQLQIQTVLSNITALAIRGRFNAVLSPGPTSLDNVVMQPPITITTQPITHSVCNGTITNFTTAATGNNNLTFQWQIFNTIIGGYVDLTNNVIYTTVASPVLNINTTSLSGTGTYRCRVSGTNTPDVFSNNAILTVNALPPAPTTTGNVACGSSAITLNASGGAAGQYRWYTVASGGTAIAGQTNSTYTTPVITSTTTYYVSINNGTCESTRTSVVATINPLPTAPTATGNAACGSSAITLNAAGGTAGQYRWYTVASGGTAIAGQTSNSITTPVLSASTTYYVSINNGTCESGRTSIVATINSIPTAPTTTGSAACGSSAITLSASGGAVGQYRWYTVALGGTAIAGETNSTYTTPIITSTASYHVSINDGTCEGNRTIATATINNIPTPPTTTGSATCGSSAITLSASGGAVGQYTWYTVASGGTAIAGETNSTYTTPIITSTTSYHVSINDGTCESNRTIATATINNIPTAPTTTGASSCVAAVITLSASGATNGEYVWYDVPSGGTSLPGQVNSTFNTPILTSTTTFYVAINNGLCESPRTSVTATIGGAGCSNSPPDITTATTSTAISGTATIDLTNLINDIDGNLDPTSIKIITQPASGAFASINNGILSINYFGLPFAGTDKLTIEACDIFNVCTQQDFTILVEGDVNVFNGISPNGDLFNNKWIIQNIETLPDTRENTVAIFNRWGDSVFEIENYDNGTRIFKGINKNGDEVTSGVYFYKIEFKSGRKTLTGYLTVKK